MAATATCALLAASLSATLFPSIAPAGADQVSSLQAQAAHISSEMLLEQLQIGGYQQQYGAAMARVQHDRQLVGQTQAAIRRDRHKISHDAATLRAAAVSAYEHSGTTPTPLFANQRTQATRSEYQQVVTGTVSVAMDRLRTDRQSLHAQEMSLQQVQAQDAATQAQARSLLQQSESTQQQLQQQSQQVQGQLAAAVAAQQAQQAAAAAAAVAAAQAKAAAAAAQQTNVHVGSPSPSPSPAPSPASAASSTTADPALNPFLQCVVQAESRGDYQAVSPTGQYMGAFQFSQPTWNQAALLAGQPQLVGVPPNQATPAQQDALAVALYNADGSQPWYDPCTNS